MALSDAQTGRRPFWRRSGSRPPANPGPPSLTRSPSLHAVLNTPVDRIRCSLVGELRVPARVSSLSVQPSPLPWRVGVHITTFEACSSFTRVTACTVAHPPYVGFIARLHPGRFPGSGARKLPSSTNNLLGWVLPPLVIFAVEAHTVTTFELSRWRGGRFRVLTFGRATAMWLYEAVPRRANLCVARLLHWVSRYRLNTHLAIALPN